MSNVYNINFGLTDKEKAMLGIAGTCHLRDNFTLGSGAPNVTNWHVVKDAGALCQEAMDSARGITHLQLQSGNANDLDGFCDSNFLKSFSIRGKGVNVLHFETKLRINDLTGMFGFGFMLNAADRSADKYNNLVSCYGVIYGNNDVVEANSSDGTDMEDTDVSAYFTDAIAVTVEIVWTLTSVEFYIDGVRRALHTTRVNTTKPAMAGFACRNQNAIVTAMYVQYCEVWTE